MPQSIVKQKFVKHIAQIYVKVFNWHVIELKRVITSKQTAFTKHSVKSISMLNYSVKFRLLMNQKK